jgi:outer membrane protein assembly factor BamB
LPDASIIALNKETGQEVWRAFHKTRRGALGGFWSTPVHRDIDGKSCLVYLPGLSVVGLDPATGETQWKYDFIEEKIEMAERGAVAASPVVLGNRVFFPFHPDHNRGFSACIEINGGEPKLLWKSMALAHWWHSPVVWSGCVIALDQGPAADGNKSGALYCYDIASGELKWSTYAIGDTSRDTLCKGAKLMIAGNKLIVFNDSGSLMVAGLTEEGPVLLARTRVFRRAGRNWTVPVLAGGRLYCRGGREGDLVCFDVSK